MIFYKISMRQQIKFYFLIFLTITFSSCTIKKYNANYRLFNSIGPYLYYYEGVQYRLYGDYDKAIKSLEIALGLDRSNSATLYELSIVHAALDRNSEAIDYLVKAISIDSTNIHYRRIATALLVNESRIDEALQNQKAIILLSNHSLNDIITLGIIYSELSSFEEAANIFNTITKNYGFIPRVSEALVKIYLHTGNIDLAEEHILKMNEFIPDNPIYKLYYGDLLFIKGEDSSAFSEYKKALSFDPSSPILQIENYKKYLEFGMSSTGIEILKNIFKNQNISDLEKIQLFYPLLLNNNLYISYTKDIDTLLVIANKIHPESKLIQEVTFEHYIRQSRYPQAREVLLTILKDDNQNFEQWERIISLDFALNNYHTANDYSKKALILFPDKHVFYILNALSNQQLGRMQEAISILEEGTNKVKNNNKGLSDIYGTLGDFYYQVGSTKKAFDSYANSIKCNQLNTRILNNWAYYLSLRKEKLDFALELSSKAVELEPNNSTYLDTKGWVLFQMERYTEARDVLRNAIAKGGSSSAVINEHYGDALFKTGNLEGALIYWQKANEIGGASNVLEEKLRLRKWIP